MWFIPHASTCSIVRSATSCVALENAAAPKITTPPRAEAAPTPAAAHAATETTAWRPPAAAPATATTTGYRQRWHEAQEQAGQHPQQPGRHRQPPQGGQPPGQRAHAGAGQQGAQLVAKHLPQHGGRHGTGEQHKHQQFAPVQVDAGRGRTRVPGQGQVLARDPGQDLVDTALYAPGEVALAKSRCHGFIDDAFGQQVGDGALQAFGGGDAQAAVVLGDDKQHAVAHAWPADLPGIAQALGVVRDVFRRGGRHHEHHHLGAAVLLKGPQLVFQRRQGGGVQGAGLVHHPRAQNGQWQHRLGPRGPGPQASQQQRQQPQRPTGARQPAQTGPHGFLKSTVGGVEMAASLATVKPALVS